ncbi:MAG TPA: M20/M25/M40 family metallo-hydrolase [Candidatus Binatia bacterium]|nr:M20/M25/M40 family metallo-hydrolase [Candidatus Binatia bacterium]
MFHRCCAAFIGAFAVLAFSAAAAQAPGEAQRARAREILERVVEMDTSIEGGRVTDMANYLAEQFRAGGFAAEDVHVIPHEQTAALVVRYRGDGTGGRPILLIGHMDVVTARRADWERDPFTLVEENGFFFGRGSYDNKAGVTALVSTFLQLKSEGFTPTRDLIIAFSGDEETSGATVRNLLTNHRQLVDAEFALNADAGGGSLNEATGAARAYVMQTAEKTYASYTLTARNPGGHSSLPRPDNAIFDVAQAIERVRNYQFRVMWNDTTVSSFRANGPLIGGEIGQAMVRFADNPGDRRAARILSTSPSAIGQIRTTCIPTMLSGGHADNALPQNASVTVNCRIFPGVSVEQIQTELQGVVGDRVTVAPLDTYYSSEASPLRQDVIDAVTAAVRASYPDMSVVPAMSAGATDGVFYRAAGIPTYGADGIFIKDSDAFSHGLDERVPVQGFYNDLTHWRVLLTTLAGRR